MKFVLSLIICSSLAGECMPPFEWHETFRTKYDCLTFGYEESLKKMTEIMAQKPAFIAVYPYMRRAINTTRESNMCHPLFKTSITFGSMDLSIFSIPCFSAST